MLLAFARTRIFAGWACAVLFVLVYPANIAMALDSLHGHGGALVAWLRLPLQLPLILWALYIARHGTSVDLPGGETTSVSPAGGDPIDDASDRLSTHRSLARRRGSQ
jgi:hypothetical protein